MRPTKYLKIFVLLVIVCLSIRLSVAQTCLSGTYYIGGTNPNYTTINDAVNALDSLGVCGPVIFKINSGTYTEQITIPYITGASAINNITFESSTGDSTSVVIQFAVITGVPNCIIKLDSAKYINIKNVHLKTTTQFSVSQVIIISNGSCNNTIEGCIIQSLFLSSGGYSNIYFEGFNNNNNIIRNNRLLYGLYSICSYSGGPIIIGNNNLIENNIFKDFYRYGIRLRKQDSLILKNNFIEVGDSGYSSIYCIHLSSCDYVKIIKNQIFCQASFYGYGMFLEGCNGTSISPILIANNYVSVWCGPGSSVGIQNNYGKYFHVYNNTITITGGTNSKCYLHQYYQNNYSYFKLKNNILHNAGYGYAFHSVYVKSSDEFDFNDYYTAGNYLIKKGSTNYSNLTQWKSSSGKDVNSISINPGFLNNVDFHLNNDSINNSGTPISVIVDDIEGDLRSTTNPDIGADEFDIINFDAGVTDYSPKGYCAGPGLINAKIKNYGNNTINSVVINWEVNGVFQDSIIINDSIITNQEKTFALDTFNFVPAINYNFRIWTGKINGNSDQKNQNDTLKINNLHVALPSGTYAIGHDTSNDFLSLNSAIKFLKNNGICGPIILDVDSGIYNEHIVLNEITGATSANTITIKASSGKNDVIIQYFAAIQDSNYIVKFDGGDYFRIKNFTFKILNPNLGTAIILTGSANHNIITDNRFYGYNQNVNGSTAIYDDYGNDKNNTYKNNYIEGFCIGLHLLGAGTTFGQEGTIIENNEILRFKNTGITTSSQDSIIIRGNTIRKEIIANSNICGIKISNSFNGFYILNNIIDLAGSSYQYSAYGIESDYDDGSSTHSGLIANNSIIVGGNGDAYGIDFYNSNYINIYNNSIHLIDGSAKGLYLVSSSHINIKNNILSILNSGQAYHIIICSSIQSDYNNLITNFGYCKVYWNSLYTTLASLQSNGKELHSVNVSPGFLSNHDLHVNNPALDSSAFPVALINDFDGDIRSTTHPDIGADEFDLKAIDASVRAISPEGICPGLTPLSAVVKNFGTDTLFHFTINWSINNVLQDSVIIFDTLTNLKEKEYYLDTINLIAGVNYNIKLWSSSPNNSVDGNNTNDTLIVNNFKTSLASGIYLIGPNINNDFASFSDAIDELNTYGICGSVVFMVDSGTYNEQIELIKIKGTSTFNTITFKSATGNKSDVVLQYQNVSNRNYVLLMNGCDNIIFQDMTLKSLGTSPLGIVIKIEEKAANNKISNNVIEGINGSNSLSSCIYNYGEDENYNEITCNTIKYGYNGIYMRGSNSKPQTRWIIHSNQITDFGENGISARNCDSLTISKNSIQTNNNNTVGIYTFGLKYYNEIKANKIILSGTGNQKGIHLDHNSGNILRQCFIKNNFISINEFAAIKYGIEIEDCDYQNIYHNSVNLTGGNINSICLRLWDNSQINVINNIFADNSGNYLYYNYQTTILNSDYNNFYTSGQHVAYINNTSYTLAAFQLTTNKDTNSVSINPVFNSNTDLHTQNINLDNKGTWIDVTEDIDGQIRDTISPDIGADEFMVVSNDAGVESFINPLHPCSGITSNIYINIKNYGTDTLFNTTIKWSINGILTDSINVNDTILSGSNKSIFLDTLTFVDGISYNFKFWTSFPNGIIDSITYNDTLVISGLKTALNSGNYTIGHNITNDYQTFNEAILDLENNGICGPVTFLIDTGTYVEKIVIPEIIGASNINTIIFASASSDSSSVILKDSIYNSGSDIILHLDGADYISFESITIRAEGSSSGHCIYISNGAKNNLIKNCRIQSIHSTSTQTSGINNNGCENENNYFLNNRIENGYYGIVATCSANSNLYSNNYYKDNVIEGFSYRGFYVFKRNKIVITGNTILSDTNSTNIPYGAYISNSDSNIVFDKNIIIIKSIGVCKGLDVYSCDASPNNPALFVNNFIICSPGGNGTSKAVSFRDSEYQMFCHNSVNIPAGSSTCYGLFINDSHCSVLNNIVTNFAGGYAYYADPYYYVTQSDYNNFYTSGNYLAYWSGNQATLSNLQTTSNKDLHSLSINPQYISNNDLHIQAVGLEGKGIAVSSVTKDIDGEFRDPSHPEIGADEFLPYNIDLSAVKFINPIPDHTISGGSLSVSLLIKNHGTSTITSFNAGFKIEGKNPIVETFNSTLLPNQQDTFNFTTNLIPTNGRFNIIGFTSLTNDQFLNNDTVFTNYFGIPIIHSAYYDDFEDTVFWYSNGPTNEWEYGDPNTNIIHSAHSPTNLWGTRLSGTYGYNALDYLYSPFFKTTSAGLDSLKFWHLIDSESSQDGGYIEYLDSNNQWSILGVQNDPNGINWCNDTSGGKPLWSGPAYSSTYLLSSYNLSTINNFKDTTQFRFVFISNNLHNNYEGWGIDDFSLSFLIPTLPDAGVVNILFPSNTTTLGSNNQIEVTIKNFGNVSLSQIPISYSINGSTPFTESLQIQLSPNQTTTYTFSSSFNSGTFPIYDFCVFTNILNDVNQMNDTICKNITNTVGIEKPDKTTIWLGQNIPNPSSGTTRIFYNVPSKSKVMFFVSNSYGQVLLRKEYNALAGLNEIKFDVGDMPEGLYLYSIIVNGNYLVKKMIIHN